MLSPIGHTREFVLLAAVIEEPNSKQPGAVYVWVNALENGKVRQRPTAQRRT